MAPISCEFSKTSFNTRMPHVWSSVCLPVQITSISSVKRQETLVVQDALLIYVQPCPGYSVNSLFFHLQLPCYRSLLLVAFPPRDPDPTAYKPNGRYSRLKARPLECGTGDRALPQASRVSAPVTCLPAWSLYQPDWVWYALMYGCFQHPIPRLLQTEYP